MLARLFLFAALSVLGAAQITIDAPTTQVAAIQCEVYQIIWAGGTAPYEIHLEDGDGKNFIEEIASSTSGSSITWIVNQPAGSILSFAIQDAAGVVGSSSQFTVQMSTNSGCLNPSASETSSTPVSTTMASSTDASRTSSTTSSASSLPPSKSSVASPSASSSPKALSAGAIAGIAVGAACCALLILGGVMWIVRRPSRRVASSIHESIDPTYEGPTDVMTSVEPFSLAERDIQFSGSPVTGSSTPIDWARKGRHDSGLSIATRRTVEGIEQPGLPLSSGESGPPGNGELSETNLDRLPVFDLGFQPPSLPGARQFSLFPPPIYSSHRPGSEMQSRLAPFAPTPVINTATRGSSRPAPRPDHAQLEQMVARSNINMNYGINPIQPSTSAAAAAAAAAFRAPAHKHAHHLHSIPPREKSTRTLIIDQLLWAHARTRFAQARAELAMTDRTGGRGSPRYAHRERPERYDEDLEAGSDGEDASSLRARDGGPGHPHDEEEDDRLARQDLKLAHALRLRAQGLEKVVAGMLAQAPLDIPFPEDEPVVPASSSSDSGDPTPPRPPPHKHLLPNGVRLRIALATVVNDLFARQAPTPREIASNAQTPGSIATPRSGDSPDSPRVASTSASANVLPPALLPLLTVSHAFQQQHPYPSPGQNSFYAGQSQYQSPASPFDFSPRPTARPTPTQRTHTLFAAGTDPSTANSPPSLRCPRHLHTQCMICVDVREAPPPRPRGSGVLPPGRGREPIMQGGGLTGFSTGTGVGSGLARRGGGDVLRRAPRIYDDGGGGTTPAGGARLTELLPRFLRLSALVATELGEETGARTPVRPAPGWYMLLAGLLTRATLEGYLFAGWRGLKPVEVLFGVGLGFHEGEYAEEDEGELENWLLPFEPEGMPRLRAALRVLFPVHASALTSSNSSASSTTDAVAREEDEDEASYEREMRARLARFLDVPSGTPDLSTHMEDLAWMFPAEPVERAALRFCESLSKWRGKPELETYRARPPSSANGPAPTPSAPADENVWRGIRRWFKIPPPSVMAERARANSASSSNASSTNYNARPPIPHLNTSGSSGLTGMMGYGGMMQSPGALHMQGSPPFGFGGGDNPRKRAWDQSGLQVPESVPPRQRIRPAGPMCSGMSLTSPCAASVQA
ncbi:unnamed protein product [Peniophora sp. CBMAI 1063]|nr:unnamed protein product [Peniophora sp. CBMAI 1063]